MRRSMMRKNREMRVAKTLKPGQTHNIGPVAGTGAPPIGDINATDLGEIVRLPDGRLVAVFGDSFTAGVCNGTHYPSVAVHALPDPSTGRVRFGDVLSGPSGSGRELFPIPARAQASHPDATFTLPAGTITAGDRTYLKVVATDGHLRPTGGSWLVEVTDQPEQGWPAIDGSYRDWQYDHTPTPAEPWRVTGRPTSAPTQLSGYLGSDGAIHIAADSFDRSCGVTLYRVDDPAHVADPATWRPLAADGTYGRPGTVARTPISPSGQCFGELCFREIDGRPVLSGLNLGGKGVEVRIGAPARPHTIFRDRPAVVGSFAPGPSHVPYPYGGFIVPDAHGNMPRLDRVSILISQWTPSGEYNTQQVWVNLSPTV